MVQNLVLCISDETKNTVSEKMCAKNPETKDDAVKSEGISSTVQASLNTTSAKANISKSLVMEESVYSKSTTSVELHNSDKSCSEIDKEIGKDLNKRHLCYTCGRVFLSRNLLHRHSSSCNINPLTIPCPNCDEVFPQISQLRTHFSTHLDPVLAEHRLNEIRQATKKESFELKCDYVLSNGSVCNKMFAYQKNLERHMDTHFDRIRSHACKECPKKYYQKSHLDEHIDNCHSLSPPRYICPYCEKQFKGRKGLSSHKLRCTK